MQQQGGGDSAVAPVAVAAWQWQPAWELGDSAASLVAAPQQEAQQQRWQRQQLARSMVAVMTVGIALTV